MSEPFVYIERDDIWKKQLVVAFILLIILAVYIYFALFFIQNEEDEIQISRPIFDLLTNKAKLPEGIENRNFLTTGDSYINPENFTIEDLESLQGLEECPENDCAVDLETGVKRCPENGKKNVVFNRAYETCSSRFFCTSDLLPFAVLSSGETDTFGVCEDEVICRCTDKIICPNYVSATINLRYGSNYIDRNTDLDYYFSQRVADADNVTGYEGIKIDANRINKEFCQINPSYTDRMTVGCDFSNTDNDILGCKDSNDFLLLDETTFENTIGVEFDFFYQNTNDYETEIYSSTLNIQQNNKPQKGFAVRDRGSGNFDFIDFTGLDGEFVTLGDDVGTTLTGLSSMIASPSGVDLDIGLPDNSGGLGNGTAQYVFSKVVFTGCINSSSKTNASNRNMLLCLQPERQPCNKGVFCYRVEDKKPTNFCQFSQTFLETTRDGLDLTALDDPKNYTLSCVNGSGCLPNYSTSFCENGNCDTSISDRKTAFTPEYDSAAASNVWLIKFSDTPISGTITYRYSDSDGIVLSNGGMLNIERGDYYSTSYLVLTKLVSEAVTTTAQFTLKLGNVDLLAVGYLLYYPKFKGQIDSIDTVNNSVVVNRLSSTETTIEAYRTVRFYDKVDQTEDGNRFGRFWVDDTGKIFPSKISVPEKYDWTIGGAPTSIYVYKQYGFNGSNYNTNLQLTYDSDTDKFSADLTYSTSSSWYYWLKGKPDRFLQPPLSSNIVILARTVDESILTRDIISAVTFSSPDADFKKNLSFYYPVWNEDENKQICTKCSPNTITYNKVIPEIRDQNGPLQRNVLQSSVIQFSGQDYKQYTYYPLLTLTEGGKNYSLTSTRFCFNFFTTINSSISNTRRIVLNEPNPNLPLSDEVDQNYYTDNKYYLLDNNNVIRRRLKFILPSSATGVPSSVNLSFLTDKLADGYYETIIYDDKYIPYEFNGVTLAIPSPTLDFVLDGSNSYYYNTTIQTGSNYFTGKVYYYQDIQFYIESEVTITEVTLNEKGQQVITTDSVSESFFSGSETTLQILSENDTLDVAYRPLNGVESLYVNRITQGRITDFTISNGGTGNIIDASPEIVLTKYRKLI